MTSNIIGIPDSNYDYEFMLISKRKDGDYDWIANFEYWDDDLDARLHDCTDYIVAHNVRIKHKELKKKDGE